MKMTQTQLVAEDFVKSLLGEYFVLTEDRIDDLIAKFNAAKTRELQAKFPDAKPEELARQPGMLNRQRVQAWFEFDPTRNKKYMPWIISQVAKGLLDLPDDGEHLRDNLMTFERLLVIPAYTGPRDIQQIKSARELDQLMVKSGDIKSKSSEERARREEGVEVVAQEGVYTLLKITNAQSLMRWGWKAYGADNPNWHKPPVVYTPDKKYGDNLWCIRFARFAESYLSAGPFYLVLKNGGPYVGIVLERGECQTLENHGINTAQAEEIYPVVKDILSTDFQRNVRVFGNIKFLKGGVKDGETVTGPVDLANTKLAQLPNKLTIRGSLDLTNCPIAQLPAALRVEGTLKISGTPITQIPEDLFVEDMEWSEPLDLPQLKALFYRMRLPDMEAHYAQHLKDQSAIPAAKREKDPKTGKVKKPVSWPVMKKQLAKRFQVDPEIDKNVKTIYRYTAPKASTAEPEL